MAWSARSRSAVSSGVLLGAANTAVIGVGIAVACAPAGQRVDVFAGITALGLCPGMLAGLVIGRLAAAVEGRPVVRFAALGVLGLATVVALGMVAGLPNFIVPAFIPTLVATAILERSTRDPAPIPCARAA
jgi:hypothetical protein